MKSKNPHPVVEHQSPTHEVTGSNPSRINNRGHESSGKVAPAVIRSVAVLMIESMGIDVKPLEPTLLFEKSVDVDSVAVVCWSLVRGGDYLTLVASQCYSDPAKNWRIQIKFNKT